MKTNDKFLSGSFNPESLDDLTNMAATMFSPISNIGSNPAPVIPDHPFGPDERSVCFFWSRVYYRFQLNFSIL